MLCRDMTSRVALVMAPLLPGIRTGVGNNNNPLVSISGLSQKMLENLGLGKTDKDG